MKEITKQCIICAKEYTQVHSKQLLCGDRLCKLERRKVCSSTENRKKQRKEYYIKNRLSWKGKHGLTKKEALDFVYNKHCEICGTTDRLIPDHCHSTGILRGVLCGQCNTGIGLLGDNFNGIEKAYNYLIRFRN